MLDLREDLDPIWRSAARLPAAPDAARVLMFTSATQGEGVTSMAASFACLAARRSDKPVWLVDLDFKQNAAFNGFKNGFARDIGRPGRALDASLKQTPIYRLTPQETAARQEKLLAVHEIAETSALVTRFRNERLKAGQKISLQPSEGWWQTLRQIAGWVIVDAPAVDRSSAALTMARFADAVMIVVAADRTTPGEVDGVRQEIEAAQGRVLGAVLNGVRADARFASRFVA